MKLEKNKVMIIGAGMVGSAILYSLLSLGDVAEIVIIDQNESKAIGEALDASHTTSFAYSPNIHIRTGTYKDCLDSQLIIITAGPSISATKPVEKQNRNQLATTNVSVLKEVMGNISKYTKDAIIIIVTNPVDILTYYAQNYFDYPSNKIIGTGTLLDTARLRRILAKKYLIDTKNVHGYVLGEHGSTAFATWSHVNIAGIPANELDDFFDSNEALDYELVMNEVKKTGYEILQYKGYTNFGIAMSVTRLAKAIFLNELSILPVSTTLKGEYGIENVALSIPCVITNEGIAKTLQIPLNDQEMESLKQSATYLQNIINTVL